MSEQQLDGAKVGAGFQQVNGERVAQCVRRHRLGDAALGPRLPADAVDGERTDWLIRPVAGKQPGAGMGLSPILPEQIEEPGRQHHVAVLAALALGNPDHHALAIGRWRTSWRAVDNLKHRVILTICYATGLRVSEAVRLTPDAIASRLITTGSFLACLPAGMTSSICHGRLSVTV